MDDPGIEPLIRALRHGNHGRRLEAATALGRIRHPRVVEALIAALRDGSSEVRLCAIEALGESGDVAATRPLGRVLQSTGSPSAAIAIACIGGPKAVETLTLALRRGAPTLWQRPAVLDALASLGGPGIAAMIGLLALPLFRGSVAQALGRARDAAAVGPLCALLPEADPNIRAAVVIALGQIGDPRAAETILPLLDDPQPMIRRQAAKGLAAFGWHGGTPRQRVLQVLLLDSYADVAATGDAALAPLCELLADRDGRLRARAAECLGLLGRREALPVLRARLGMLREREAAVRARVREAIARIEGQATATHGRPRTDAAPAVGTDGRPRIQIDVPVPGRRPRAE